MPTARMRTTWLCSAARSVPVARSARARTRLNLDIMARLRGGPSPSPGVERPVSFLSACSRHRVDRLCGMCRIYRAGELAQDFGVDAAGRATMRDKTDD